MPALRRFAWLLLVPALAFAAGCTTITKATKDKTRLRGEVPAGLGRILEVQLSGFDDATRVELASAIEREFVAGNLFERVRELDADRASGGLTSLLVVKKVESSVDDLVDVFNFESAHIARFEMTIDLQDERGRQVLGGHISGIGVDSVTESEFLNAEKRSDVRVAALHDASMKMSRALRQAANARADKALETLTPIRLPQGFGTLLVAVLGFDDGKAARRRQGPEMALHVSNALGKLGEGVVVLPAATVRRALEREPDVTNAFVTLHKKQVERLVPHLGGASLFVVGKVSRSGGVVRAEVRVVSRLSAEMVKFTAEAKGLGALRVVAVKLVRGIGQALEKRAQEQR